MVLASADTTTDLAKLADMADKIVEVVAPPTVATTSTSASEIQELKAEVARLTDLVASITHHHPHRGQSRSRGHRPHSPAPTDTHSPCWYHKKFGEAAKKCQEPGKE